MLPSSSSPPAYLDFELDLFGSLLAKIRDRLPPREHVVAEDFPLGLVFRAEDFADRLEVADRRVRRLSFSNVR